MKHDARHSHNATYHGKGGTPLGGAEELSEREARREGDEAHVWACLAAGGFGRNETLPNGCVVWVRP